MKKLIITEEEKKHIKNLYEQISGAARPAKLPPNKKGGNTQIDKKLIDLMKKVYLRYKPLGRDGLDRNTKVDQDVLQLQKYFNSTGELGVDMKYDKLVEDGIFGGNTFWQVNNKLGSLDQNWWEQNSY